MVLGCAGVLGHREACCEQAEAGLGCSAVRAMGLGCQQEVSTIGTWQRGPRDWMPEVCGFLLAMASAVGQVFFHFPVT